MERAFNFKLLVPPRTNISQVSAVKPQESGMFEDTSSYVPPVQGFNKCFDKETSMQFSNTNMVLPTKPPRAEVTRKIAVMPMEKEDSPLRSSQLYSKLLEEAEKIKVWKLKMDSEILHKERMLQDNKRTIETQRKAIQELQFENESLSMKLEEQLYENEDLQNKNNATRNLCNILKDTFERSAEKMSLFEAEKEETHDLFMQNHKNIQRMVAAFENLRIQAEADQQELLKVKEGLKQFEDLKLRFEKDYCIKEEEVVMLNEKFKEKESDLKDLQQNFQETQQNFTALQESAKQQLELFQTCEQEQKALQEKLKKEEQLRQEFEENRKSLVNTLEKTKEKYVNNLQERDIKFEDMNKIKEQLALQLEEVHLAKDSLQSSLTVEKKRVEELESERSSLSEELSIKNTELGNMKEANKQHDIQIQTLKNEMETRLKRLKYLEEKIQADDEKMIQLISEHAEKQTEMNELKERLKFATAENKNMVATLKDAVEEKNLLKEDVLLKEKKLQEIEGQLSEALKNEQESSSNTERLKNDLRQFKERYDDLLEKFHQLNLKKNTEEKESSDSESKVLEENKESEEKLKMKVQRLEEDKQQLQKQVELLSAEIKEHYQENENIQGQLKESNKSFQNKQMKKQKQIKALELKLTNLKTKLETKDKAHEECLKENKALKEQMAAQNKKCSHHKTEITELKEEHQKLKDHNEKEYKKICSELEDKSASEAQLKLEVEKLKQKAVESIKIKEDSEVRCQQKISDMVALMERHKHEYDKMVEEKDAELSEKRMQEAEVNANKTSLELELSHLQVENGQLNQQLEELKIIKKSLQQKVQELTKTQTSQKYTYTKKEQHLEQKIVALKKQITSLKSNNIQKLSETTTKNKKLFETPETASTKMSTRLRKTEIDTPLRKGLATPFSLDNSLPTSSSWTLETKTGSTPRIRSFRIRTPPSTEKAAPWRKNILELDPKSDSSEQHDVLGFSAVPLKAKKQEKDSEPLSLGLFKKVQSSAGYKSPGAALKLATMKRMRDAGWTTVTSSDKKKKKGTEKIFA
ncbi:synaptonemal complex protein 1 isoform X2 [Trichomycterus rosablanca]|uniref:synaptonemal complex protein 1 isoform X2 n=1 Tax=Trichomycterus rosablanca TaxID=2290929 RepID=UPI002F3605C2